MSIPCPLSLCHYQLDMVCVWGGGGGGGGRGQGITRGSMIRMLYSSTLIFLY